MTTELEQERAALARAELDIVEGQERIDRQVEAVAQARAKGLDLKEGDRLLALMRDTLAEWKHHRELIAQRIEHLERRGRGAT